MPHLSFFKLRIWKQQAEPPAVLISSCSAMRLFRRRQQLLCVRVLGMVEQLVHRPLFHNAPLLHHQSRIAKLVDHVQIVRDEQVAEVQFIPQLPQQF